MTAAASWPSGRSSENQFQTKIYDCKPLFHRRLVFGSFLIGSNDRPPFCGPRQFRNYLDLPGSYDINKGFNTHGYQDCSRIRKIFRDPAFSAGRLPALLGRHASGAGFRISPALRGGAGRHPGGGGPGPGRFRRPGDLCPRGRTLPRLAGGSCQGTGTPGVCLIRGGGLDGDSFCSSFATPAT